MLMHNEELEGKGDTEGGFTLIETLVALFILTFALVPPLTLSFDALKSARSSKMNLTAFYLADEGIQFVKNIRDSNTNAGVSWLTNLDGAQGCIGQWCAFDPGEATDSGSGTYGLQTIKKCGAGGVALDPHFIACDWLEYIDAGNYYYLNSNPPVKNYKRGLLVTLINVDAAILAVDPAYPKYEALVTVRVEWSVDGVAHDYELSQIIYDSQSASVETVPICGDTICEVWELASCAADCGAGSGGLDSDTTLAGNPDPDTIPDGGDNCWCASNINQFDGDGDEVGNVCDADNGAFVKCCNADCGCVAAGTCP